MRVLYFSTAFGPHDHRFLASLARTRHAVYFLRLSARVESRRDPRVPAQIHQVPWPGIHGPFRWRHVPRLVRELKQVIRDVKPDLIHAGPIQTCAFVAVLTGFWPVLTMSWGFDLMQDAQRSLLSRWVTQRTLKKSAFFVSDAKVTRDRAIAYGMRPERTAMFPWGVDLRRFHPVHKPEHLVRGVPAQRVSRQRWATQDSGKKLVLLCNRSWETRYGVDVLARAFVIASRELSGLSLILLGAGSRGRLIRAILERGGQLPRVHFVGSIQQTRMQHWYRKADLYISPSHVDGSSVSLMEAMASGMPALVSDIPGNREWISEGKNGWLFRDGDARHLAERILWIAGQRPTLARIGRAARKTAEERADWRRNFKVLLAAYERAVALDRPL